MQTDLGPDNRPIDSLPLPTRAHTALRKAQIETISQLRALTLPDLMELKNVGRGTALEVVRVLQQVPPAPESAPGRWRNAPLSLLNLPPVVFNAVRARGIEVVGQLCRLTPLQLPANLRAPVLTALAPLGLGFQGRAAVDPSELPLLESLSADWAAEPVAALALAPRTVNALRRAGITTLGQVCARTPRELLAIRTFGRTCLADLRHACYPTLLSEQPAADPPAVEAPAPIPDAATLDDWLALLLEGLKPKARQVLVLRWGLFSGQPLTLDQVGRQVGITGERVRQLQNKALRRLAPMASFRLVRFSAHVAELVRAAGGVVRAAAVAGAVTQRYPAHGVDAAAFARFAFPHCRDLVDWQDDRWAVVEADRAVHRRVVSTLVGLLQHAGRPLLAAELVTRTCAEHTEVDPRFVAACLWAGGPLHILPGDWVALGGRSTGGGLFALAGWGLTGVTKIADLLEAALQEIGGPARTEELVAYVMARKAYREISIRHYLAQDPRFLRVGPNLYALARWAADGGAAAHLLELRAVPKRPDLIVQVLERLVAHGRMAPASLGSFLAELRQASCLDDYRCYLVGRGWAVVAEDGWLAPTGRARALCAIADPTERLLRFAMSDANFQTYLALRFTEHLIWLSGGSRRARSRVPIWLSGGLAPLRPIHAVVARRLQSLGAQAASAEARERLLARVVRAPGDPQLYVRWVEPVTGCNPWQPTAVCKWLVDRMGSFPAWPSTVLLSRIPRPAARLLCLATALAAAADAAVDFARLVACADRLGLDCPDLAVLAAELLAWGVILDDQDPAQVRLLSPHDLFLQPADVPGGLPGGLDALRSSLWAAGVLVSRRDGRDAVPAVRLHVTAPVEDGRR